MPIAETAPGAVAADDRLGLGELYCVMDMRGSHILDGVIKPPAEPIDEDNEGVPAEVSWLTRRGILISGKLPSLLCGRYIASRSWARDIPERFGVDATSMYAAEDECEAR